MRICCVKGCEGACVGDQFTCREHFNESQNRSRKRSRRRSAVLGLIGGYLDASEESISEARKLLEELRGLYGRK